MRRGLAAFMVCLAHAAIAASQPATPPRGASVLTLEQVIADLATQGVRAAEAGVVQPFSAAVDRSAGGPILNLLAGQLVERQAYKTLVELMLVRADTQIGSSPGSSGSTSLAMKGLVPAILGFAVEHGAITRDVDGTVATFRVSPAGLVRALQGRGLLDIYDDYSRNHAFNLASRVSAAASFDTSRGDVPNTVLANARQLSAWSVTAVLIDRRDPRAKRYAEQWRGVGVERMPEYIRARQNLTAALGQWRAFTGWQDTLTQRVAREVDDPLQKDGDSRAAAARFRIILAQELPRLEGLEAADSQVTAAMTAYVSQLTAVVKARNEVYKYAHEGALATIDWTTTRDAGLPDLFTLTGVVTASFTPSRKDDFTANVAFSFYRAAPAGSDRKYKEFSLALEWDRPLGSVFEIPFIFTAGTRYQFIPGDIPVPASAIARPTTADGSVAAATTVATSSSSAIAPKGHLLVGQAKLTIPLRNGVRIPLSVTFANRTELIAEKTVGANVGVTFDLDALAAAVKARQ